MTLTEQSQWIRNNLGKKIQWAGLHPVLVCVDLGNGFFRDETGRDWPVGNGFAPEQWELVEEKRGNMIAELKGYFAKHKDIIMTIGLVLVIDNFVFGGAFREKVKSLIEKMLLGAEKKIHALADSDKP